MPRSFVGLIVALIAFIIAAPGSPLTNFTASFAAAFTPAFGVMSIVLVIVLAADLARRRGVSPKVAIATAAIGFALSLPFRRGLPLQSLLTKLGPSGVFLAIGTAIITVATLSLAERRFGKRVGTLAAVVAVVTLFAAVAACGISLPAVLAALMAPLGRLGDSLAALLVIVLLETLLWAIGIHGPALLAAIILPIYLHLQAQNTAALAADAPLPHIVTVSLFLFVFPGGAGSTFSLVMLLVRSRVRSIRRIAYAALLPAFANANEPLMFGLPIVMNPTLCVPFVAAPLVLAVVSYAAVALGFVTRPEYYVPSTIPLPLGVWLATHDWRAIVLLAVNIAIACAIYAPFVARFERSRLASQTNSTI